MLNLHYHVIQTIVSFLYFSIFWQMTHCIISPCNVLLSFIDGVGSQKMQYFETPPLLPWKIADFSKGMEVADQMMVYGLRQLIRTGGSILLAATVISVFLSWCKN